ncbi:MAG: hypothetical protein L7F77_04335 [Candidatus Magnetominusculus sp. LBB02]|nr:hypothetical protein [Candidatus Magnetominusculus sp. LBB02]
MLIIRRAFYFVINCSIAIIALLVFEGAVAYIKYLFCIYSPPFNDNVTASRAYMIVLPFIMALLDSRLMKRGFIAGGFTSCEIISPQNLNLSFLGCYLRVCFLFMPTLIYISVFNPYNISHTFKHYSQTYFNTIISAVHGIDVILLFIILFIPISILINKGHQGIHDYILHIQFQKKNSNRSAPVNIVNTVIMTLIIAVATSIILDVLIVNSPYYKRYCYELNRMAMSVPDLESLQMQNDARINYDNGTIDSLIINLKHSSIVNNAPIGVDYYIEKHNNEQYPVIDIATNINLNDTYTIYRYAYEIALKLDKHNLNIDEIKVKLSNRFRFDIIAFEKYTIFSLRKEDNIVDVNIDRYSLVFPVSIPIGFKTNLFYLIGS